MGAYSYKEVMYRGDFQDAIAPAMESCGETAADYDGDANYDGHGWVVAAFLLEKKDERIAALEARVQELEKRNALLEINGIHSCWDECPRLACVQARRIRELETVLQDVQNWDLNWADGLDSNVERIKTMVSEVLRK